MVARGGHFSSSRPFSSDGRTSFTPCPDSCPMMARAAPSVACKYQERAPNSQQNQLNGMIGTWDYQSGIRTSRTAGRLSPKQTWQQWGNINAVKTKHGTNFFCVNELWSMVETNGALKPTGSGQAF